MAAEEGEALVALRESKHGKPKPFGSRFRLPTLRFSGAAMAMSTVVGISLATTWLLNEQQHIGPQPRTSVGASPPEPSPDGSSTLQADPVASASPVPAPSGTVPPSALGHTQILRKSQPPAPSPTAPPPATTAPATPPTAPATPITPPAPDDPGTPAAGDAPTASPSPSPSPASTTKPPHLGMAPTPPPTQPAPETENALSGTVERDQLGSGTRHTLVLAVDEQMTALQVEFRLRRPAVLPGTTPWTDVPNAVATAALERDTLVYRSTLPSGHDLPKGKYAFTITGGTPEQPAPTDAETWTASAFALAQPRAVTSRGAFDQTLAERPRASR